MKLVSLGPSNSLAATLQKSYHHQLIVIKNFDNFWRLALAQCHLLFSTNVDITLQLKLLCSSSSRRSGLLQGPLSHHDSVTLHQGEPHSTFILVH